jgi:hypothetical protein
MLHADSSDWPSLAIGGARTVDITSSGNGYRRSPLRTDEPKPGSLADCVSRTASLERKRAFPTVPACDPDACTSRETNRAEILTGFIRRSVFRTSRLPCS